MSSTHVLSVAILLMVAAVNVSALVASAKLPLWTINITSAATNPFADGGVIYAPTQRAVYAINVSTGELFWTFAVPSDDNTGYIATDVELVFVGGVKRVYALSRSSGVVAWTYDVPLVPSPPNPTTHARPTCFAGKVYVTTGNSPLVALDAKTGHLIFELPSGGIAQLHATKGDGDRLYFINQYFPNLNFAVCANATNGKLLWTIPNIVTLIVAEKAGLLYSQYGNAAGSGVLASNLTTGATVFNLTYPEMQAVDYFYDGNKVLFTDVGATDAPFPTTLYSLDASTSKIHWSVVVSFLFFLPVAGGIVNFAPTAAEFYHASTGHLGWSYNATAVNDGATSNGVVVFPTATQIVALSIV